MRTIRVDYEVWEWLKCHARPLEDTPNSVLRRLAGLNAAPADVAERPIDPIAPTTQGRRERMDTAKYRHTGEGLRREYGLPVRHCLYHKDGTFYERLAYFPGALCDPQGYVQFETEAEFEHDSRLNIGKKVNVPGGLFTHPKYRRFPQRGEAAV